MGRPGLAGRLGQDATRPLVVHGRRKAADNSGEESYPSAFSSVISVDFDHITDKFRILYRPNGRIEFVKKDRIELLNWNNMEPNRER